MPLDSSPTTNRRYGRQVLLWVLLGVAVYAAGVTTRRAVLDAQYRLHGYDLPFTLESALHYRRVKMLYDRGGPLPERDPMVFHPDGVVTREVYTYGWEVVQAAAMRWFPESIGPERAVRWVDVLWFCLGIPMLGIWVATRSRSVIGGVTASLFYAVALSSVIRSTGQELSRENAALPLVIGFFMASALADRCRSPGASGAWSALAAASVTLALATWDLVQFPVALWSAARIAQFVVRPASRQASSRRTTVLTVAGLLVLGVVNPYHRTHGLLVSPVTGLALGALLTALVRTPPAGAWRRLLPALVPVLALLSWSFLSAYGQSYSHFGGLLVAKLQHGNVKPVDPSLLTFDQRVMWVPALHSADFALTLERFPASLFLVLVTAGPVLLHTRRNPLPDVPALAVYTVVSVAAFVLFVRFHVFAALFASAWLGMAAGSAFRSRRFAVQVVTALLMVLGMTVEAFHTLERPERWGRTNLYLPELRQLCTWLEDELAPYPVLANMGVSGSIAAYGKCAIALHPKFEQPGIRDRYRTYGETLFGESEQAFRDFAESLGVRHVVYAKGEFAPVGIPYQMRYFVNRLDAGASSVAWRFEHAPETLVYFYPLWSNRKYAVFAMRTAADEADARTRLAEGRDALAQGRLDEAEQAALAAWELDPTLTNAVDLIGTVQGLRAAGFEDRGADE